jgi:plastocyanin
MSLSVPRDRRRQMGRVARLSMLAFAALAFAMVASPAVGGAPVASKAKRVAVKDNLFSPRSVHVGKGGRVTWIWKGAVDHNVTFTKVPSGASKRSSSTKASGRFSRTFGKRGKYRYVCTIHKVLGMRGSVTVP